MQIYRLNPELDEHGQPVHLFRKARENNAAKAVDQLAGICAGILADGVVSQTEARFFADWVRKFSPQEPVWPFTDVLARLDRIFADGKCDDEELTELREVMAALIGHQSEEFSEEHRSTTLPIDSPLPSDIAFENRVFSITGKFAFGPRKKVMNAISERGGIPSDSAPTRESHYLVIGVFASRDWIKTNSGRKIERAIELRQGGSEISIIPEEHWRKFVA